MLNCGKKKYSNSRVVRKKNSERNKKNITPSLQVKWWVPNHIGGVIGSSCGGEFDIRWGQIKGCEICVC